MAKKKNSSRRESPEDAAKRLKKEELARLHAEARQEIVQKRILAAEEIAANRTKLHFLSSKAIATGPVETFDRFPIEVKIQIFKELTDIDSLHSLISASRSFHKCYINDQYQCEVFCKILVDEMTLPIFLQAVAIFSDSVRRIRWTGEWTEAFRNVREFMDQYSTNSRATTFNKRSYNMRTLVSIAEFHLTIKAVTRDFFESCLDLHPWTHEKYEKNELGRLEELRIQRAFYNLELYVRLFKRGDYYLNARTLLNKRLHGIIRGRRNVRREIYESFFNHFSFWELEEIVSVKDYMEREYNDIINECKDFLAKNSQAQQYGSPSTLKKIHEAGNIKLGGYDYFTKHYNNFTRTFINKGVEFFWKVCNQNGPKTKIPLIDIPIQQDTMLLSTQLTKMMMIDYYTKDQATNNQRSQTKTSEYLHFLNCYRRSLESRGGQLDLPSSLFAWNFINSFMISRMYYFRDYLSSWGYCMWDMERLVHIQDIFWLPLNVLLKHGPRLRLSSRVVLLPAL
ncbi:hypothetical protein BCON_0147g00210 [Botryotinia convoluta]|uniref:F-box domain-containing protein n=1 Tax=Botryotinia convoluta TaxID=54673 RepID=A0A4Z1HTS4_9HELO|nr:hypothetical protein BCON_0147g00210 [Botryotinia convoluta]